MVEKSAVIDALNEIGVLIEDKTNKEGYIIDIPDSLTYIGAIVNLEDIFNIAFEDDHLTGVLFSSIENLTMTINEIMGCQTEKDIANT